MLTVDRKRFLSALDTVARAAESKSSMPVLSKVQIHATDGALALACTDLYTAVSAVVAYTGEGSIAPCAVDVRAALDRAKKLPNGHACLAWDSGKLAIADGPRRFTLPGIEGEECPPIPSPASSHRIVTLDASVLSRAIDRVIHSVSGDFTRPHYNAVLFELSETRMRLVATDGHRLSLHDEPIRGVTFPVKVSGKDTAMRMRTESEVSWLVSLSAVGHIRRLVGAKPAKGEPSALATIGTDGKNLFVSCRGVDIATRLVEATFPPYAQVIPGSSERKAIVSREALLSALQAVSTCTSKRTGGIKLTFADGSVRLFASDPDEGEADEKVAASMGRGDGALCKLKPLTIGVNASYMLDALTVLASDEVTLATSGELDPIVVRGKDESTLAIVMPMRI